jgi:copper chaperone NosL
MVCAAVGLADFWRWEYDYGHDLDFENAIIKVPGMTYQPPLIGSKQLLNFTATSWPATGAIAGGIAMALGVVALAASARGPRRPAGRTLGDGSVVAVGPAAHGVART